MDLCRRSFEGKAPVRDLNKGERIVNLDLDMLLSNNQEVDRIINKITGDYIWLELKTGKVERENYDDPFRISAYYRATVQAEYLTFLGQRFETKKMLPQFLKKNVKEYPETVSSLHGYEINGISSPYQTGLKVLVENGKMVENEISLMAVGALHDLKEAAEGDSSKMKNTTTFGFIGVWLILLLVVLWLEGRWIKSKSE